MPGNKLVKQRVELLELIGEEELFRRYVEDYKNHADLCQDVFAAVKGKAGHYAFYIWLDAVEGRRERWRLVKKMKAQQHLAAAELEAELVTEDNVRSTKVKIDTRKWIASVLDKEGFGTGPAVQVTNNNVNVLGDQIAQALRAIEQEERDKRTQEIVVEEAE